MSDKHDILTEDDVASRTLRPCFKALLNECALKFGIQCSDVRVLDWGCGRGAMVAKLLELGFDAYGVDVDPEPIRNGRKLFLSRGIVAENRLIKIGEDCQTHFPAGFFHAIISDQVFEHVVNLENFSRECARLTAYGGEGIHVFPARWRPIEPHLQLMFLHWLPKNRLRYIYIRLMLFRVPVWKELSSLAPSGRANAYYIYSIKKTFYRSTHVIEMTLATHGFSVSYQSSSLLPYFLRNGALLYERTFREVILRTVTCNQPTVSSEANNE